MSGSSSQPATDLSVIIPAINEGPNLALLLPELRRVLEALSIRWEILIVVRETDPETLEAAQESGAEVVVQDRPGYGGALLTGFDKARGEYLLTMDADLSHRPVFVEDLWKNRDRAELVIASRYVDGGQADMPWSRFLLSRILNGLFRTGLSLPVRDLSSGFRLYKASLVRGRKYRARNFDILQELLLHAYADGWHVAEVPFSYAPREHGNSHARVLKFGKAYLKTFLPLWKYRNSIQSADYDYRAYNSRIWLQKHWQRSRFRIITDLIKGEGPVLDIGCGSSRIIAALPPGSVALDVLPRKLRFARRMGVPLVAGSGFHLPFRDEAFPCVLCSEVIEHVPKDSPILDECLRVLAPGGRLVLGTPDYARREWVTFEKLYGTVAPGAYAEEHISHYTRDELVDCLTARGLQLEDIRYILRSEMILALRKPNGASPS